MPDHDTRDHYQRRVAAMRTERESFIQHYRDLAQFVTPRRGRFYTQDRNKGDRRWGEIINSEATRALRVCTAGIFTGIMSPSRPWHWLGPMQDPELAEFGPVKGWLHFVLEQQREIFRQSNLYNMVPVLIKEVIQFGTGCISHEDDKDTVQRFFTETVGSYMIGQDESYRVNTVVREKEMTVEQIIRRFSEKGEVNPDISPAVRRAWDTGRYDQWYPVTHFVDENPDHDENSRRSERKRYRSVYYEPGHVDRDAFLSKRGFDVFPFYVPRWEVTGEDIYATDCPGMTALGDVRGLQHEEKRKAQAIDKLVNPPLQGPPSLQNVPIRNLPGHATVYGAEGNHVLRPIHEVNPRLNEMMLDIEKVERRIQQAYYVDLFNAISEMEGVQPRNQLELSQRNAERLLQLGPVLERLQNDFQAQLVERTFRQQIARGMLPDAPEELQGQPLEIKFVSTLAMAQQAITTGNVERLYAYVTAVSQTHPEARHKFDALQSIDLFADLIGAPPELVVPDDEVQARLQQEAQEQQALQAAQFAQQAGQAINQAGNTQINPETLAGRVLDGPPER